MFLLRGLAVVVEVELARGTRTAVRTAPKMTALRINMDIIPIIMSNCFFDRPHSTSPLSPGGEVVLDWGGVLVLRRTGGD